jgi:glycosyltransferase involved in cell wall biosynthesis
MKVALVHDWLVAYRGGERVLDAMARIFPEADLYTLLRKPGALPPSLESRHPRTSPLQALPGVHRYYKHLLPILPAAIRSLSLERGGYDLVISSSSCVAKGIRVPAGARHLSYVHAPMRYMWHHFGDYFGPGRAGLVTRLGARAARPFLRRWDVHSSRGVDRFVANSRHIAGRIHELYGREASVVYPPVDLDRFVRQPPGQGRGGYLLWLGAMVPYKRVDLAIAAAARSGLPLWIGGQGQLPPGPLPPSVRFLGVVKEEEVPALYRDARALLFTGEEDFGLTPLEAQACGRPVVALARGGALETVTPRTGLFFGEPTVDSLLDALRALDGWERTFDPLEARANALRFGQEPFREGLLREVAALMTPA